MIKRYFSKTITKYGTWKERRSMTRYIVTAKEWKTIQEICDSFANGTDYEKKVAKSITTYSRPYEKKYEGDPDMPEDSYSFILFEEESEFFDNSILYAAFDLLTELQKS